MDPNTAPHCRTSNNGDLESRVRELEAKNAELEERLAIDGTRREEQVGLACFLFPMVYRTLFCESRSVYGVFLHACGLCMIVILAPRITCLSSCLCLLSVFFHELMAMIVVPAKIRTCGAAPTHISARISRT